MAKKQDPELLPADDTAEAAPTDQAAVPAADAPAKPAQARVRVVVRDQLRVRVGAQDGRPVFETVEPGDEILLDREEAERLIACGAAHAPQKKRGRRA